MDVKHLKVNLKLYYFNFESEKANMKIKKMQSVQQWAEKRDKQK